MQFPWTLEPSPSELFVYIYGSPLLHLQDEGVPTEGLHEVKLHSPLGEAILVSVRSTSAWACDHYCSVL